MGLTWHESYTVKISVIDEQHKKLFELINKLHSSIRTPDAEVVVKKVIEELANYVEVHFSLEELYLEKAKYPQLDAHKREHLEMLKEIESKSEKLLRSDNLFTDMIELYLYLQEWINEHILVSDQKYVAYLNEFQDLK